MAVAGYAIVPLGSRHTETGLLLEGRAGFVLRLDGGGEWRLDAPRKAYRLVGRRVCVTGVRDGFDLLAVMSIEPAGATGREPPPRGNILTRMVQWAWPWYRS